MVDLGSGGGVPGLVIARARPDLRLVLVDRRAARTDHLDPPGRAASTSTIGSTCVNADADELAGSMPPADAVVARGLRVARRRRCGGRAGWSGPAG